MNHCRHRRLALALCLLALLFFRSQAASAQLNMDLENPPFNYAETEADNRVSRLIGLSIRRLQTLGCFDAREHFFDLA